MDKLIHEWFVLLGLCWLGHECSTYRSWVSCWLVGYAIYECAVSRGATQVMSGGGPALYYDLVWGVLTTGRFCVRRETHSIGFLSICRAPSTAPPHPTSGSIPRGLFESECFLGRQFSCLLTDGWPLADGGPCIGRSPLPMGPMAPVLFPDIFTISNFTL